MGSRLAVAFVGLVAACAVGVAFAQTGVPAGMADSVSVSSSSVITSEQRTRLAQKLELIDQIVRAAEPALQANNTGLEQKRWMLDSLYSAPLEAIREMVVPGDFTAIAAAMSRAQVSRKSIGDRQTDLVYRPLTPCRYIDTRNVGGPITSVRGFDLGNSGLTYGGSANCNPKTSAPFSSDSHIGALAVNLTVVSPAVSPGFMGMRPAGSTNTTSMVNWYQHGPNVQMANAGVVSTQLFSADGNEFELFGTPAQIIVDVHGIFTAPEDGFVPQKYEAGIGMVAGASFDLSFELPFDRPIAVTGTTLTPGVRGVGQVTLLRCCAGTDEFLQWVGLDSPAGAGITQGFSNVVGTKIVFLDYAHQVILQVGSAGKIRLSNTSPGARSMALKLIY